MARTRVNEALALLAGLSLVLVAGCAAPDVKRDSSLDNANPRPGPNPAQPSLGAVAGFPVKSEELAKAQVAGGVRSDPFALTPVEASYEKEQLAANLATMGGFPLFYQPTETVEPTPIIEEQPYRRLAGIMIGDSVSALIDMGNGQLTEIYPGEKIPGTDWVVVSIDSEKAVIRRGGDKLPKELIVRLETAPSGVEQNNGGTGTGTGLPPGLPPGVPPGGRPPRQGPGTAGSPGGG